MPVLCQTYMLFFCLPLSSQPRLNLSTQPQGRAPPVWCPPPRAALLLCVEPWLNTQWQTEKQHILLAEDGHIFLTCLQLVGTWVKHNFKNLVSEFLTCPRPVGTWVKHIFRNLIPQLWRVMLFVACHVLNVACHGVSKSIVSIISVSCRVRILRVSVSEPCRGHLVSWLQFANFLDQGRRGECMDPLGIKECEIWNPKEGTSNQHNQTRFWPKCRLPDQQTHPD